ncbi:hypothetical protein J4408_03370 [Candidatus Pacearchaeota archaeon]|nr:hypothetical protein [Candidatus Pacearchaeota archaeon]
MAATKKEMSKEERIAFHQGALNTLLGERNELLKMVQTVESLIQAHVSELKTLGVKFEAAKEEGKKP